MATHHVDLLKGLPGPVWTVDSIARRARLNNNSGSSGAHPFQVALMLLPKRAT